ncbi:MAG: zinc ABC transporter substrate-binding protein [Planctomycetes bacterium]|nr:zinc ABC transporter substrate-binding protein [Planctomycetota bacterium]
MIKKTATVTIRSQGALLLAMLIAAGGCGGRGEPVEQGKPQVFVSVAPLAYFAERIAGRHVTVSVLIAPGGNPHTYTPTPRQVVRLSRAGLLLCAGSGFEQIVSSKLAWGNTQLRVVNVAEGAAEHGHHEDSHVWMSPRIARTLAEGICRELCTLDPPHTDDYRNNLRKLQGDLDDLDARLTKTLAPIKGKTFFVFHPAFGYFAKAYGLKQEAIESEGKSPGPRHRSDLIARVKAAGVKTIFVQPQFSRQAADVIAKEIGGKVAVLDPLSADYINNLEHIAEELRKALQP